MSACNSLLFTPAWAFGRLWFSLLALLRVTACRRGRFCGISSHTNCALRSINTCSNICGLRARATVGFVFLSHLRWPVSTVQTSPWTRFTFRLWPTKLCLERLDAESSPVEVVAFVQSIQCFLCEPTPPLPSVSLLWLMSFPSCCPLQLKKENLPIRLAFTLTWLFLLNTHENTQAWLDCSLSYFSQIPLRVLPFFHPFKGMTGFLF